jgi:putative transposase
MTPRPNTQPRRTYDHRLREHVCRNGVRSLDRHLHIPRSTVATWHKRGPRAVVTVGAFEQDRQALLSKVDKLERRVRRLAAVVRLLLALLRVSRFRLAGDRLPQGEDKATLLRAITGAQSALPLASILSVLRLPASRYHAWRRADKTCGLQDRSSCPRTSPGQLTAVEIGTIKDMVLDPEHRHIPLSTLCLYAQRIGKVFASVTTWAKLVRERGWRRPRTRVHPAKPTVGVRATRPNEYWHIDVTILRLLDGTTAYVHAIIDNYSRKILAWLVADRLQPAANVLVAGSNFLDPTVTPTTVVADSGVENVNAVVDATLVAACLHRVLAQVEVTFSNSMIEAFWRSLKHQWLFLNSLDTIARLRTLVAFFVEEHNTKMPHAAFRGQTPDEMYFGTKPNLTLELAAARKEAFEQRLAANRSTSCGRCSTAEAPSTSGIPP